MERTSSNSYDVVIIGAGISGLVCGCYLAKGGMKVLIAEQHHQPGGYCTSFQRKNFTFDAAANSLGGFKHGILGKVFNELDLISKMRLLRFDPSGVVITPDFKVSFWKNLDEITREFQRIFPGEKGNIEKFFQFIVSPSPQFLAQIRQWTFKKLLDLYTNNDTLKAILSFPLFGNTGLPPSQLSAFLGLSIFKEYILDGGYYPEGGMQALPNALAERLKELGGELRLSQAVIEIKVKNSNVNGVVLEKDGLIISKYVVSSCDARSTFLTLLGKKHANQEMLNSLKTMVPSASMFIAYLGIKDLPNNPLEPGINTWLLSQYNLDRIYLSMKKWDYNNVRDYLVHRSPDKKSITALMFAPYKTKKYWDSNKAKALNVFMKRIEIDLIAGLSGQVVYKDAATPHTLHRYTLNYKGAAYGWAGMPTQFALSGLRKPSFIQGLYLTGHWTTYGLGIPGVTYIGYDTAKTILNKQKKV
jgi:phytoene dehydrogenase-like protein